MPSIAFQLRHVAGSLDRLLTYAEGRALNEQQLAALQSERGAELSREAVFEELGETLALSSERMRGLGANSAALQEPRTVSSKFCPPLWRDSSCTSRNIRSATWAKPSPPPKYFWPSAMSEPDAR